MDPLRVRGIARRAEPGDGPVVLRIVVSAAGARVGRIDRVVAFELEREDAPGERVRVEPTGKVRLEPMSEERDRWDAFEDDPDLAPLRKRAPGPHVPVIVERAVIREGDRVVVAGEALEHAFDDRTAGPRAAPVRRLTRMKASVIAVGEDADALVTRALRGGKGKKTKPTKPPARRRKPSASVVAAAASALFAVLAFVMPRAPLQADFVAWSAGLFAAGAALAAAARMPRFVYGGKPASIALEDHRKHVALATGLALSLAFFPTFDDAIGYGSTHRSPPINASYVSVVAVAVQIAVVLFLTARATSRGASLLRVLLRSPSWGPRDLDDVWGATEGTVRDPTPVKIEGEEHAVANVIEREVRSGSDPDIVVEKVLNRGTFFVESDAGSFELDPTHATWASAVRLVPPEENRKDADRSKVTDVVPIGGTVLVAGRASREWKGRPATIAGAGPESLLFFATAAGRSPRARARRVLAVRLLGLLAVAACLAVLIVTASSLERELPAFHIEGD